MSIENESMGNKEKESLLRAILDFIKKIFSSGNQNGIGKISEPLDKALSSRKFNNDIAKEAIEDNKACLSLINDFIQENKDELTDLIEKNKLNDVSDMIKSDLMPNIETYLATKELSDETKSNPLRRLDDYRHEIMDNVNAAFKSEFEGIGNVVDRVSENLDKKMTVPNHSHNEALNISPRTEPSKEVSRETQREMLKDAPTTPSFD